MYLMKTLWNIALNNGFRPTGNAKDDLIGVTVHLPMQVIRNIQRTQPKSPVLPIYQNMVENVLRTSMGSMDLLEQDRTLIGVYAERVREVLVPPPPPPPRPGKGEPQEGSGEDGESPPSEGENDGKKSKAPAAPQPNGTGQGSGTPPPAPPPPQAGQGNQGGTDAPPAPKQSNSSPSPANKPARKTPTPKPKTRTPEQLRKELDKGERERQRMETNLSSAGGSETSAPDKALAQRIRQVLAKIMGAFGQVVTPRIDGRKLVTRHFTHRTLEQARKEEDGQPSIAFLSDVSPSCNDTSQMSTQSANSACLNGTIQARILSLPLNNWDYDVNGFSDRKYQSYHNGKYVEYSLSFLRDKNGLSTIKTAGDMLGSTGMSAEQYLEQHGFKQDPQLASYGMGKVQALMVAKELGSPLSPRTKSLHIGTMRAQINVRANNVDTVLPRDSDARSLLLRLMDNAVTPLVDDASNILSRTQRHEEILNEIRNKHPLLSAAMNNTDGWLRSTNTQGLYSDGVSADHLTNAIVTNLDADIVVYFTDTDGTWRVRSLLAVMKPHQKLYVLTYASMPDTLNKQGKWAVTVPEENVNANNGFKTHNRRGQYNAPPVANQYAGANAKGAAQYKTVGLSRPLYAFSPKSAFDVGYIPHWLGAHNGNPDISNGYADMAMAPHAKQLTLIPNVVDVDGYVKALELIASPDRMNGARQGGANMVKEIEATRATHWGSKDHPLGVY